jgi:transposase-like protein
METESIYTGTRRYLSRQQKEEILREHTDLGVPIAQLARKNGINAVSIYQWKRNMNQDDESITPEKIRELLLEISKLKNENKHLKVKVADLSVTNDILTDAIEIAKKRAILKQVELAAKSKNLKNSK